MLSPALRVSVGQDWLLGWRIRRLLRRDDVVVVVQAGGNQLIPNRPTTCLYWIYITGFNNSFFLLSHVKFNTMTLRICGVINGSMNDSRWTDALHTNVDW